MSLNLSMTELGPLSLQALSRFLSQMPDEGAFKAPKFSKGEKTVMRRPAPVTVSVWAEKNRVIHTSSRPGYWRNSVTPYTAGFMDASFMDGVRQIVLMKSPQTGGTECVHNCVGYSIDRKPGPVLYVYPDEITARENARDRIIPMIKDSPRLSGFITDLDDDVSTLRINLLHTTIYMAWSGSASRLGNKPIRYLILDELDKYQDSQKEAPSVALAEKRVITWGEEARVWKISTPTTTEGPIWKAWEGAQARFRWHAVCPFCGTAQIMDFDHLEWPEDMPVKDIISTKSGRYHCPHCEKLWTDSDRDEAVRRGFWAEEASGRPLAEHIREKKPAIIAFHVPALISPFVSLSDIAAKMAEYNVTQDLNLLKDLQNNYKGEPWEDLVSGRTPEGILSLCDDRPRGIVPGKKDNMPRVCVLLAGVDTQLRYFRYVIRAIGFGETQETWLVQEGVAPSFEALEDLLFNSEYLDENGEPHRVRNVIIDAMGEQRRTAAVYEWASKHKGVVFPSQGVHKMNGAPWKMTALDWFPAVDGRKLKIPGGLQLYRLDSTYYKNILAGRLAIAPEDPGAFHLHAPSEGDPLTSYAKEMSAETWDAEKNGGTWVNARQKPNHAWDCEYLICALADILQIKRLAPPRQERQGARAQESVPTRRTPRRWSRWGR